MSTPPEPTTAPTSAASGSWRPRWKQAALARLVGRLNARRKLAPTERRRGYAGLVRLGLDSGETTVAFRERLIRAQLKPSRASEITTILRDPKVAAAFTATKHPLSVRQALAQARGARPGGIGPPANPPGASDPLEAKLNNLCAELLPDPYWQSLRTLDCGIFTLEVAPVPIPNRAFGLHRRKPALNQDAETTPIQLPKTGLRVLLPANTAELLSDIGGFCGLNRAEIITEILTRQKLANQYSGQWEWVQKALANLERERTPPNIGSAAPAAANSTT